MGILHCESYLTCPAILTISPGSVRALLCVCWRMHYEVHVEVETVLCLSPCSAALLHLPWHWVASEMCSNKMLIIVTQRKNRRVYNFSWTDNRFVSGKGLWSWHMRTQCAGLLTGWRCVSGHGISVAVWRSSKSLYCSEICVFLSLFTLPYDLICRSVVGWQRPQRTSDWPWVLMTSE